MFPRLSLSFADSTEYEPSAAYTPTAVESPQVGDGLGEKIK